MLKNKNSLIETATIFLKLTCKVISTSVTDDLINRHIFSVLNYLFAYLYAIIGIK